MFAGSALQQMSSDCWIVINALRWLYILMDDFLLSCPECSTVGSPSMAQVTTPTPTSVNPSVNYSSENESISPPTAFAPPTLPTWMQGYTSPFQKYSSSRSGTGVSITEGNIIICCKVCESSKWKSLLYRPSTLYTTFYMHTQSYVTVDCLRLSYTGVPN